MNPAVAQFRRRVVSISSIIIGCAVVSALLPALLVVALFIDLLRRRSDLVTSRLALMLWCFLGVETLGLFELLAIWLTTNAQSEARMQRTYAATRHFTQRHLAAVTRIFALTFKVTGEELVVPGPLVIFVRHSSLVDVLIPSRFIANVHQIDLRYVIKRELLIDPCLDIGGHFTPNHFVDRSGRHTAKEAAAIAQLKRGLQANQGVVIYPEGTRFSRRKRDALLGRLKGPARARAEKLRHLLPIHSGGAMTLLAAQPKCDVLFVGHHGLEGLTQLADIWQGKLYGRTVTVQFWRERGETIPESRDEQRHFVDSCWQRIDDWLETISNPTETPKLV